MFTGIIRELGRISKPATGRDGCLRLTAPRTAAAASVGDSIAVNGVCLTVISVERDELSFHVSYETLKVTNLGELSRGKKVNLEPSLRAADFIGGHFVSGHVEAVGIVRRRNKIGDDLRLEIDAPTQTNLLLVERGSITVDGVSLTVVDVKAAGFSVVIIPHTAGVTNLGGRQVGERVNLESDLLARYVKRIIETQSAEGPKGDKTMAALIERNFIKES